MLRAIVLSVLCAVCLTSMQSLSDILIATTSDPNATLGIPRHKVHVSQKNPDWWWVLFGRHQGNLKMSTDGGLTWTGLDPDSITIANWLDYHAMMAGDDKSNLFFTFPEAGDQTQRFRRMDAPARTYGDLRTVVTLATVAPGHWKRGSLLASSGGDTVWVFTRSSYSAVGNVRYHRSTDGGASWYVTPADSGYVRETGYSNVRIGSVEYMGKPAAVIWYDGQGYRYYRWDGSEWVGHADSTIYWGTCTRDENPGNNNFLPMLTRSGETLYVVYSRVMGGPSDRAICYKVWNGNNWSIMPLAVSTGESNCRHPNVPPSVPAQATHIPVIWTAGSGPYSVMCGRIPALPYLSLDEAK